MDFFNCLFFSSNKNPYAFVDLGAFYPPLCYLLYKGVLLFVPPGDVTDRFLIRGNQVLLVLFFLLTFAMLFFFAAMVADKINSKTKYVLGFCLILSFPMLYEIERGNIILLTFVLLMFFVFYKDSDSKVIRELSLIALAVSAAIKIYPALFGVLLFFDEKRDYKRIARLILYGVLFFFVPFFCFSGFNSIQMFFHNLLSASSFTQSTDWTMSFRIDPQPSLYFFYMLILKINPFQTASFGILTKLLVAAFSVLNILYLIFAKERWKKALALADLVIIIPSFSYSYCGIFLIIPLLLWFMETKKGGMLNTIPETIIIIFIFLILAPIPMVSNSLKAMVLLNTMYGFLFIDLIVILIERAKARRAKNTIPAA